MFRNFQTFYYIHNYKYVDCYPGYNHRWLEHNTSFRVCMNNLFYFFSEVIVQNSKRGNIEWSSICKNAGTTFGMLTGHPLFLALQSVPISNNYLRYYFNMGQKNVGLINLKGKFNHTRNYSNFFYCFK
jgi:hypothetical protein